MSPKCRETPSKVSPLMDFRAQDEAWYAVRLLLEGDKLVVMYRDFPEASDECYLAEDFLDLESVEEFLKRFRQTSSQLQDQNCDVVVKGRKVCACNLFAENDLRYYDAIVESVNPSIHALKEGACRCKFELLWQHGPQKGKKSILGIENICLIKYQGTVAEATLTNFLDIVKEKLKLKENRNEPKLGSFALNLTKSNMGPELEHTSSSTARGRSSSESMINYLEQDVDMGGQSHQHQKFRKIITSYFCRIDNLEKDLSPFTMMHFVQEHLKIQCFALTCPSISDEFCTRGFILLEEEHQAEKLRTFLLNSEYVIASLKGRPWIINDACFGITEGIIPTYEVKPYDAVEEPKNQLKLIHKGTSEYDKIDKLRSLHSEFHEHVRVLLLQRLLAEERKLLAEK